jgi:hypothetical protein
MCNTHTHVVGAGWRQCDTHVQAHLMYLIHNVGCQVPVPAENGTPTIMDVYSCRICFATWTE